MAPSNAGIVTQLPGEMVSGHIGLADALLRYGGSIQKMHAAAPLPKNTQELIERKLVEVGLSRLTLVGDWIAAGLTVSLSNPLSYTDLYWEKISRAGGAQVSMEPKVRGERGLQDRKGVAVPIPVVTDDFSLGIRAILAAERVGQPLDVSGLGQSVRSVNETVEDMALNGWTESGGNLVNVAGNNIPGIFNAPSVNTQAYGSGLAWDDTTKTGQNILDDVSAMISKLQAVKKYGPYYLGVNTSHGNKLNQDFKALGSDTILQRLQAYQAGGRGLTVRTVDFCPKDKVFLMQMTDDVMDVIVGQMPTTISWADPSGFVRSWLVMSVIIPRVKDDYNGQSGICLGSKT